MFFSILPERYKVDAKVAQAAEEEGADRDLVEIADNRQEIRQFEDYSEGKIQQEQAAEQHARKGHDSVAKRPVRGR